MNFALNFNLICGPILGTFSSRSNHGSLFGIRYARSETKSYGKINSDSFIVLSFGPSPTNFRSTVIIRIYNIVCVCVHGAVRHI